MRQFDAFVRGKRVLYKQKVLTRLKETILVGGGLFSMSYHQKRIFLFEFMSHWLMLSLFGLLQNELFASSNPTFFSFAERINKLMTSDPHKIF